MLAVFVEIKAILTCVGYANSAINSGAALEENVRPKPTEMAIQKLFILSN